VSLSLSLFLGFALLDLALDVSLDLGLVLLFKLSQRSAGLGYLFLLGGLWGKLGWCRRWLLLLGLSGSNFLIVNLILLLLSHRLD